MHSYKPIKGKDSDADTDKPSANNESVSIESVAVATSVSQSSETGTASIVPTSIEVTESMNTAPTNAYEHVHPRKRKLRQRNMLVYGNALFIVIASSTIALSWLHLSILFQ